MKNGQRNFWGNVAVLLGASGRFGALRSCPDGATKTQGSAPELTAFSRLLMAKRRAEGLESDKWRMFNRLSSNP
jgi:hypothetical protein